jgi:hypothetical protein
MFLLKCLNYLTYKIKNMEILLCEKCKHYGGALACLAFPGGIPKEILFAENDHSSPLPGQLDNLVFEPSDPVEWAAMKAAAGPDFESEVDKEFPPGGPFY